jgi:catechol 2,3-dioxygenase-like lactoylglutathione lyase family enzyme
LRLSTELNHIIVPAKDKWESARFLARILGVEAGPEWGHFVPVRVGRVTIDFDNAKNVSHHHCAFLLGEAEFDAALDRIKKAGIQFFAEFDRTGPDEINRNYGGRGVYFDDPNGHLFELITRPYGEVPEQWIDGKAVRATGG